MGKFHCGYGMHCPGDTRGIAPFSAFERIRMGVETCVFKLNPGACIERPIEKENDLCGK